MEQTPRRRLFTRQNPPPALQITARDMRILRLVYEYRFLTTKQVQMLVDGSARSICERLSRMYHNGYLDRPLQQLALRVFGHREMIYALTLKGARLLAQHLQQPRFLNSRWNQNNRDVRAPHLLHTLMISEVRACATLACRARTDLALTAWSSPDRALAHAMIDGSRVPVIPDGAFTLSRRTDDEIDSPFGPGVGIRHAHFFLECDRGTVRHKRFAEKLAAYWKTHAQRRQLVEALPKAFRVLTVTTSQKRLEGLLDVARSADPRGTGLRMFWFTTIGRLKVDRPETFLDPIWRVPVDDTLHSLLD